MMPSLFLIAKPAELFIAEIRVQFLPGLHVDFLLESFVNNPRYFSLPFMGVSQVTDQWKSSISMTM